MNRYIYLLASTLFFFACSDDNSANSSENSDTTKYQHVSIDKANRSILVDYDAHTEEYCILEQGSFNWGEVPYDGSLGYDVTPYEIHGDTLIVFFNGMTDDPHYYLGGSTDKIYGEWKNINCYKNQDKTYCQSQTARNFREQYEELVLTISENKFQEETVYKPAYFKFDDYMNSLYLPYLYNALRNDFAYSTIEMIGTLFIPEQESVIKSIESGYSVETLEQTKTAKKFKQEGKTYEVKITDIERDSLDYKVAISVKSGDKECTYEERQVSVTKENCKDQTTEGLQDYDADRVFNEELAIRGTIVNTKGLEEFDKCINEISVYYGR